MKKPPIKYSKKLGIFRNHQIKKELNDLDPILDHQRMVHLLVAYEFYWDMLRSLELAFFRTYCSPYISKLLDKTGEFSKDPQKRYDDTLILVVEFIENGYDSPMGKKAIDIMNRVHGHFKIRNEDYIFVMSTIILDPIHWIEKYGWRKMSNDEKNAFFYFFKAVAERMHITDFPTTLQSLKTFEESYKNKYFIYDPSNERVAKSNEKVMKGWMPWPLSVFSSKVISTMIDQKERKSLGYAEPNFFFNFLVKGFLKSRVYLLKIFNPHKSPTLLSNTPTKTYPKGYQIEQVGPSYIHKKNQH